MARQIGPVQGGLSGGDARLLIKCGHRALTYGQTLAKPKANVKRKSTSDN
jgi:hypothetical protein